MNNGTLASWDTKGLSGTFVVRLDAWDKSNNHAQDTVTVSIKAIPTDTTPPAISFVTVTPFPFSPNNDGKKDTSTLSFYLSEDAALTVTVLGSAGNPVRSLYTANAFQGTQNIVWDGKDDFGSFVFSGTYTFRIEAQDAAGNKGTSSANVVVDTVKPVASVVQVAPQAFSPNNDGIADTVTFSYTLSEAGYVTANVLNSANTVVFRFFITPKLQPSQMQNVTWDGTGNLGEGFYTLYVQVEDLAGNVSDIAKGNVLLDFGPPEIKNVSDVPDPFSPNNATSVGEKDTVTITADLVDSSDVSWQVQIKNTSSAIVKTFSGTTKTIQVTWDGKDAQDGLYTYLIDATDSIGNIAEQKSGTVTVDNTSPSIQNVSASPNPFSPNNATSIGVKDTTQIQANIVDANPDTWQITIYDASNQPVRTFTGSGTSISTTWDGKNSAGDFVADGIYTLSFSATDLASNKGSAESTVSVDNTNTVTTLSFGAPNFESGGKKYITPNTLLTLSAADPVINGVASGLSYTQYRIDGGSFISYTTAPFFLAEGIHTVEYQSIDNVGNTESLKSETFHVDNTPPVTTLTVGNPQYTNGGKLYISEKTTLTLTAFDPVVQNVSSGLSVIQYRMDGGNWNTYVSPFTLPEGVRVVDYRSLDNVQNTELAKSITLHVDGTTPGTSISIGTPQCTVYANPVVTYATPFTLTPVDPVKNNVASGVNYTQYRINSGNWQTYAASFTIPTSFSDGTVTIDFRSQDNVENLESIKTQVVILDNASPTTQILSPQANSTVNNTFAVVGVVTDTYFADKGYYTVEYGSGSSPSSFTTIQSATFEQRNCNVDNPTCTPLTYWNTANVTQNQTYTVRLSTQDCVGNATSKQVTFKVGEPPFVLSFGEKSKGQKPNDGEFNEPAGLATIIGSDGKENIAVSDKQNHRVQIFSGTGQFLTKFGEKSKGGSHNNGEFNEPTEIVVRDSGSGVWEIYVVDSINDRVQKFDKNYAFVSAYGTHGNGVGQFIKPYGVALDSSGNMYITDMQNNRVQKLDANGNFIKEWTQLTRFVNGNMEVFTFNKSSGIVMDAQSNLYVSDSHNDRILKFTQDGTLILSIEGTGQTQAPNSFGDHPLKQPLGLALDNFGNLYVADQMNHRVQKFDPWGFRLLNFGTKTQGGGDPAGTFNQVADMLLDSTQKFIYVSDIYNHRVQRFAIVTDAPAVAKLMAAKPEDKETIISDPNLLNVLKVVPYPTPTHGKMSFNLEVEGNVTGITLEVYTINGKRVLMEYLPALPAPASKGKGKYKADSPSLDAALESLPNGVYVYRLQISNGVKTVNKAGKFVVVK